MRRVRFEFYKQAGISGTREKCREALTFGSCFSHFSSVLKNSQVLIELNNARGTSFFLFFS